MQVIFVREKIEFLFSNGIKFLAFLSIAILILILGFIFKESMGLFSKETFLNFIFGTEWNPLGNAPVVGIKPFIVATIYVSFIAVIIAMPIGLGAAVFISILAPKFLKNILKAFINILSGIPSVVYGFIGLSVMVKLFEVHFSFATGESIFCAGVLLAVMILPYIVSACDESLGKAYDKYKNHSKALGVSKWYTLNNLIIPACRGSILSSAILATGRAMGETMSVMMVIGNSPIMPKLFDKGETIPALIAMEMGSAQIGSVHYHALFASGFVLMIMLLIINAVFYGINRKLKK